MGSTIEFGYFEKENKHLYRSEEEEKLIQDCAEALNHEWKQQKKANLETRYLNLLTNIYNNFEEFSPSFLKEGMMKAGKRFPSFLESLEESVKRLRIIQELKINLPESVIGYGYGGSLSYGKFYNVRGGKDPSDIDLFYIVDPNYFREKDILQSFPEKAGFNMQNIVELIKRAQTYKKIRNLYHIL